MAGSQIPRPKKQLAKASRSIHETLKNEVTKLLTRFITYCISWLLPVWWVKLKKHAQCESLVRSGDSSWARSDAKKGTAFAKHLKNAFHGRRETSHLEPKKPFVSLKTKWTIENSRIWPNYKQTIWTPIFPRFERFQPLQWFLNIGKTKHRLHPTGL